MRKPNSLSRYSEDDTSRIDAHSLNEGHLLALEIDNIREEEDAEDVELEVINYATWERKIGLRAGQ